MIKRSKQRVNITIVTCVIMLLSITALAAQTKYQSPYSTTYMYTMLDLAGDIINGHRGDAKYESSINYSKWNSEQVQKDYGFFGPPLREYEPPQALYTAPAEWKRERLIAAAVRLIGYNYQYHNIPDWVPAAGWAWDPVSCGHNGKGIDSSSFVSFIYSQALGVSFHGYHPFYSSKMAKAKSVTINGSGGTELTVFDIPNNVSYKQMISKLKTGDLLFFKNEDGNVTHVAIWVGKIGNSPDGVPLVIDSLDEVVIDSMGQQIPTGVQLRPFYQQSSYYKTFDHALRVVHDQLIK